MKQDKVWGTTERFLDLPALTVDGLEILAGTYCSQHRHARKTNLFLVISGELEIDVWRGNRDIFDTHTVKPGETAIVLPGTWHRFRSVIGAKVTEICFVSGEAPRIDEDIERRTVGGRMEQA